MAHPTQSAAVVVSEDWSKPSVAKESHPGEIGGSDLHISHFPLTGRGGRAYGDGNWMLDCVERNRLWLVRCESNTQGHTTM